MQTSDLIRYGLWSGIVATAAGNQREYGMKTTWLPHLITNSISLFLPEIYRLAAKDNTNDQSTTWRVIDQTMKKIVCDNPNYVVYVAPFAAGYLLSSPWFNIYKGDLGKLELAGFGLDALPHSATALGLTALVCDVIEAATNSIPSTSSLAPTFRWSNEHVALVSAAVLALATLAWEFGEYRIYRHELALLGDPEKINMQWTMSNTLYDCAANAMGWGLAIALRGARKGSLKSAFHRSARQIGDV